MHRRILYLFINFTEMIFTLEYLDGWGYINIHCRDNDNKPIDWWYLYKPPKEDATYKYSGQNFSYVTSGSAGKWQSSNIFITASSMFQNTLKPAYRQTYSQNMAIVSFDSRSPSDNQSGTSASGVLMADEMGGVWLGYTLPDLKIFGIDDRPTITENEIENGHLMMCLSLDIDTLDSVAAYLNFVQPNFTQVRIPTSMKPLLPNWEFRNPPYTKSIPRNVERLFEFTTIGKSNVTLLARPPGKKKCLYADFAMLKSIVLDVYGYTESEQVTSVCGEDYGVRNIEKISLKGKFDDNYIKQKNDRSRFAVSRPPHSERTGSGSATYWTCTSNLDKEDDTGRGGILLCLNDYNVWMIFDNLIVAKPKC